MPKGKTPCSARDIAARNNNEDLLRLLEKEASAPKIVVIDPRRKSMSTGMCFI
jgi:hypothetical protein